MDISQVWPEWHEDCVLGEGSFGKVFRAKRTEYGRTFYSAIKMINVPKSQQEIKQARAQGMNDNDIYSYFRGIVDNLLNEITLMDNLKGAQNIVGIEDYKIIEHNGDIGWDIFIRMELLTPFDSFVSNPEFSQMDVIKLGVDLCSALEVCERNYIVHRDIKPDNIFISRFGEYKLGDFGIARKLEATQANLSRKGTLNYMAPEVYKSEEYGSNVDIYSLGLVLYTLLNNNRIAFLPPYPQPITYTDNETALSKRLAGEPIPLPCNATPTLGAIILKACAYSPWERYRSATEMKNDLIAEWNALAQSGSNKGINNAVNSAGSDRKAQSITNDMTANGQVIIGKHDAGTTVLENGNAEHQGSYAQTGAGSSEISNVELPSGYSAVKPVKACVIFSYILAAILGVMSAMLLLAGIDSIQKTMALVVFVLAFTMIVARNNKSAIGIGVIAGSLTYVMEGIGQMLSEVHAVFPLLSVVTILSGCLALFGGIVILVQKEVRFGGSLCVYSLIIEVLVNTYLLINGDFVFDFWHFLFGVAMFTAFIWAFGYNSGHKRTIVGTVLKIVTFILSGIAAARMIWFVIETVASIL